MTKQEAFDFIKNSISTPGETWADLGAGSGTFTLPISQLLGKNGKVIAIDTDSKVLQITNSNTDQAEISSIQADFTKNLDLPILDGIFLANALHYVKDQKEFLQQCIYKLKPNGKFVFIEYDHMRSNPWVPYPISFSKLKELTSELNLTELVEINRRTSRYGNGDLYLAICEKIQVS